MSGTAAADGGESATPREQVATVARRIADNGPLAVLSSLLFVYALFTLIVLATNGFELNVGTANALLNTLASITFLAAVYALLALALNLHWGYTGLFNIGVAGFVAIGVFTMGALSSPPDATSGMGLGLPLPIGLLGGMVMAALVGLLAALPALRLRADYLAIVTLGLSEIIRLTLTSGRLSSWTGEHLGFATGGGSGMNLPANPIDGLTDLGPVVAFIDWTGELGLRRTITSDWIEVTVMVGFVVAFFWLLNRIGFSPFGRVLKAIREDELVAQSLGKDTRMFKIKVFMLGCALMGLAGALWQLSIGYASPGQTTFRPLLTFYVFVAVIIGGSGSNYGSVAGSILFVGLLFEGPRRVGSLIRNSAELGSAPNTFAGAVAPLAELDVIPFFAYALNNIAPLQFILMGVVLIIIMQKRPEGVLGHRSEIASAVSLDRPERSNGGESRE